MNLIFNQFLMLAWGNSLYGRNFVKHVLIVYFIFLFRNDQAQSFSHDPVVSSHSAIGYFDNFSHKNSTIHTNTTNRKENKRQPLSSPPGLGEDLHNSIKRHQFVASLSMVLAFVLPTGFLNHYFKNHTPQIAYHTIDSDKPYTVLCVFRI